MVWKPIVGKAFDQSNFQRWLALQPILFRPRFIVVHNTSAPSLKQYRAFRMHTSIEQWLQNLVGWYKNPQPGIKPAWPSGPHFFVGPDGIGAFTPPTTSGTHSPKWNSYSIGVETVGEFQSEPFDGAIRDNLIFVLACLHIHFGLDPDTLRFHKEDPLTTHRTCPGKNMVKADLIAAVQTKIETMGAATADDAGDAGVHHADMPVPEPTAPGPDKAAPVPGSVEWLQASLNKLGAAPQLTVDGDYGPATERAAIAFQQKTGTLTVDGVVGAKTRAAMTLALAALPAASAA